MKKLKKISNILLILAFLIIITMPQLLITVFKVENPQDTSENRKLAEKPKFDANKPLIYATEYEAYYNDNLPFRSVIRNAWTNFNFQILNEAMTNQVLVGKNEGDISSSWLFYQSNLENENNPVKEAQGLLSFSAKEYDQILSMMDVNKTELEKRNIELYYAFIPNKENVYKDKFPEHVIIYDDNTRVDKLVNHILENTELTNVIYLKNALESEKNDFQVYHKQDTHWNDYGAFIGFRQIMSEINDEYTDFTHKVTKVDEKIIEMDLSKMSGINDILKDIDYEVEFLPDVKYDETVIETDNKIIITECPNAPINKTLMLVGDSYRSGMIPYFAKVYSKVIFLHRCDYANHLLDAYQPDVVIGQFLERYVDTVSEFKFY